MGWRPQIIALLTKLIPSSRLFISAILLFAILPTKLSLGYFSDGVPHTKKDSFFEHFIGRTYSQESGT